MELGKYSFGIGDRFGHQGENQLRAFLKVIDAGFNVVPVWNKSNREHSYIQSKPRHTRMEADSAVKALDYKGKYFVDADHINLGNVQGFIPDSDYFTIDVAAKIGLKSSVEEIESFIDSCRQYSGELHIPGISHSINVDEFLLRKITTKFFEAIKEAGKIYQFIREQKGEGNFVTEISMDEVEAAQTPVEMFFILKMIADQGIPVQTIAPKFTGRFNKGVDYSGNVEQFTIEFEEDILVIASAVKEFGLPGNLKLSVHSGSDKFSIYPEMGKIIRKYNKGIHIKTAGTTWLEEVIGLSLAGGTALKMAKNIYKRGFLRKEELCSAYKDVIEINNSELPSPEDVNRWEGQKFANTLRHIPGHPDYNSNFRQLIHVSYKIAAEYGEEYTNLLKIHNDLIGNCVEENILDRHLKRLFEFQPLIL